MTPEAKPVSTPRPWHHRRELGIGSFIETNDGKAIAFTCQQTGEKDTYIEHANAALIVKAVNRDHLFDELVEALETLTYQGNTLENIVKSQKLVKQAKELSK